MVHSTKTRDTEAVSLVLKWIDESTSGIYYAGKVQGTTPLITQKDTQGQ